MINKKGRTDRLLYIKVGMLTILLWGVISPSVAQKRYRTGDVLNVQLRHGKPETGAGLENELTDAVCKEIQIHHMIPLFRKQAFGERLLAGVKEVRRVMSNRPKNNALSTMKEKNTDEGIKGILVILAIVVSAILFFAISYDEFKFARSGRIGRSVVSRKTSFYVIGIIAICCFPGLILLPLFVLFKLLFRRRLTCSVPCPSCRAVGAFKNIRKEFHVEFETVGNKKLRTQHWSFVCKKCGFRMKEKVYDDVSEFAMLTQNVIQTMRSKGRNSDNDEEGSWGGGGSGGGGASTRF
ncbi:hypothetical protein Tanf_12890 [Tannerella forsythia]|nr:hypothetical protein Tanf_12890 [Tannerella forsythia]